MGSFSGVTGRVSSIAARGLVSTARENSGANVQSQLTDLHTANADLSVYVKARRGRAYAYRSPSSIDEEADVVPAIITGNGNAGRILRKEARQGQLKVGVSVRSHEHSDESYKLILTRERKRAWCSAATMRAVTIEQSLTLSWRMSLPRVVSLATTACGNTTAARTHVHPAESCAGDIGGDGSAALWDDGVVLSVLAHELKSQETCRRIPRGGRACIFGGPSSQSMAANQRSAGQDSILLLYAKRGFSNSGKGQRGIGWRRTYRQVVFRDGLLAELVGLLDFFRALDEFARDGADAPFDLGVGRVPQEEHVGLRGCEVGPEGGVIVSREL